MKLKALGLILTAILTRGMTFHSRTTKIESKEKETELGLKGWIKGKT